MNPYYCPVCDHEHCQCPKTNIRKLDQSKPDENIVSKLRDLLAEAEKGNVQQIAIVHADAKLQWTTHYVGNQDALVAGLERMKFRILRNWT